MNHGKYIFSQITDWIPRFGFENCVKRYGGDKKIRSLTCRDQFLAMMFGQLANFRSLRGIVVCLNAHKKQLYHLGFRTDKFVLTTLTRANEKRSWEIYKDFADMLIGKARTLYADNKIELDLQGTAYILDSTTIELCLSIFPWAKVDEKIRAAVKVHTQLDLKARIPSFFLITDALFHDLNLLDIINIEEGAYYIMDRGYTDYKRWYKIHQSKAFFVIRAKDRVSFKRMYSSKVFGEDIRSDQIGRLTQWKSRTLYPEKMRRVKYRDKESGEYYVYLTNNLDLSAKTIADMYKQRWQIELFFKWLKQHLHIEVFWGRSENAVKTQICIALCAFLVVAIIKKELKIDRNLYEILQILSTSQFEKTGLNTLLSTVESQSEDTENKNQLYLWDILTQH